MRNEGREEWTTVAFEEESDIKKMVYENQSNFFLRLKEASISILPLTTIVISDSGKMLITLGGKTVGKRIFTVSKLSLSRHLLIIKKDSLYDLILKSNLMIKLKITNHGLNCYHVPLQRMQWEHIICIIFMPKTLN